MEGGGVSRLIIGGKEGARFTQKWNGVFAIYVYLKHNTLPLLITEVQGYA